MKTNNRELQIKTLTDDIIGKIVLDSKGNKIGKVADLAISKDSFPTVEGIIISKTMSLIKLKKGKSKKYIDWRHIEKIENNKFILRNVNFTDIPTDKMFLVRDFLDEQLVDRKNQFIGRIDDIELIYSKNDNTLTVAGFYSGVSGIIMNIGTKKYATYMQKLFGKDIENDLIPWNNIKKVCIKPKKIVVNFTIKKYENIYAKLIEKLSKLFLITNDDAEKILQSVKPEIVEKRFGLEFVKVGVKERFEIFVDNIKNKKIKMHYAALLKLIEYNEEKYNALIEKNKKFKSTIENLFLDLIEHFKNNKKLNEEKIKRNVEFVRKTFLKNNQ